MLDLSTLNPPQRDAVTTIRGPLMILAGAGTGKTRVITVRIAHMLEKGIEPSSIVALSFTNKAAREMAERARHIAGHRAKDVWLGTFHSFCLQLLRDNYKAAGLASRFGLAGTSDQLDLVRRALDEKAWAGLYDAEAIHQEIGDAKNKLLTPADVLGPKGRHYKDAAILSAVYELYERQLKLNRVIDFDDCIFKVVQLLRSNGEVRDEARRKFKYLMVDEYQDTNDAQLAVMEQLASDDHDVCVVGDDDQSIYSWRGAMYEILQRFEEMFPKTRVIKLEQNYRCTNVILDAANTVIRNNTVRKDKTLWSASKDQTPIQLVPCEDDEAEARFVVAKCMSLLGAGHEPRDIGILYRANAQARAFEMMLREARISYKTYGGQSFFERKEVKDFVSYLRMVLNEDDRLAMWRVINSPQRGIGIKTLERIEELAKTRHRSPFDIIARADPSESLGGRAGEATGAFVRLIRGLAALPRATPADYEALGNAIIKESGLDVDIKLKTENADTREKKLQNLRSLPKWIGTVAEDLLKAKGKLEEQEMLDVMTLDNDRREEKDTGGNHVSLMTIHAAKGLEFPAVFVVGVEEEYLPHKNSVADLKAVAEERRLFYVALTRAKVKLYLSHCMERSTAYSKVSRMPSRFLKEMPQHTLSSAEGEQTMQTFQQKEADRKTKTASKLSELRASLSKL